MLPLSMVQCISYSGPNKLHAKGCFGESGDTMFFTWVPLWGCKGWGNPCALSFFAHSHTRVDQSLALGLCPLQCLIHLESFPEKMKLILFVTPAVQQLKQCSFSQWRMWNCLYEEIYAICELGGYCVSGERVAKELNQFELALDCRNLIKYSVEILIPLKLTSGNVELSLDSWWEEKSPVRNPRIF